MSKDSNIKEPNDYLEAAAKYLNQANEDNWNTQARESFAKIAEVNLIMYNALKNKK